MQDRKDVLEVRLQKIRLKMSADSILIIIFKNTLFQGSYNLKWDFHASKPDGQREEIGCVHFAIKIL